MRENIFYLDDYKEAPPAKKISLNQVYYGSRVDYNLKNISSSGYQYFVDVLEGLFKTVIHFSGKTTNAGFYLKVDNELKKLSLHQCKNIIVLIDGYLERPHLKDSQEREFFMRIRNLCFMRVYQFQKNIIR